VKHSFFIIILAFLIPWTSQKVSKKLPLPKPVKRSELSQIEIQLIKGIGPKLSSDIMQTREPLTEIHGIGEVRLSYLQHYISEE
jgi:hypothetical protein